MTKEIWTTIGCRKSTYSLFVKERTRRKLESFDALIRTLLGEKVEKK